MEKEQRSDDGRASGQQDESSNEEDPQEQQPLALVRHQIVIITHPSLQNGFQRYISAQRLLTANLAFARVQQQYIYERAVSMVAYAVSLREIRIFAPSIPEIQALISGVRAASMMMLPFQRYLMLIVRRRSVYLSEGRISVVTSSWIFDTLDRSINEIRYGAFIRQERGVPALDFSSASQAMTPIRQISFNPLPSLVIPATRDIAVHHRYLIIRDVPEALNVQLNRLSICDVPEANSADRSTNARSSSPEPLTCGVEEGQADPHDDEGLGEGTSDSSGSERDSDESPD